MMRFFKVSPYCYQTVTAVFETINCWAYLLASPARSGRRAWTPLTWLPRVLRWTARVHMYQEREFDALLMGEKRQRFISLNFNKIYLIILTNM